MTEECSGRQPRSATYLSATPRKMRQSPTAIVEALESHGIKCWIAPRDVRPGTVYADAIVGAINESKALVLVLSANAMPSAHVGREVERAASKRKQVIAFRVDATPLSRELEYFLSNSQWIDVPKLGMPAALTTLTAAVRQAPATSPQSVPVGRRCWWTEEERCHRRCGRRRVPCSCRGRVLLVIEPQQRSDSRGRSVDWRSGTSPRQASRSPTNPSPSCPSPT